MKKDLKLSIKFLFIISVLIISANIFNVSYATEESEEKQFEYLSNISYVANQSSCGWGNITMDKTTEGKTLSLKINGSTVVFKKGVFAHAKSTIVYDISAYDYDYFTTYYGVSAHQGSNGSVKFYIYTSADGKTWELQTEQNPPVLTGSSNSQFVKIPIKGKKFIKLYADPNGNNGSDHALYGDAKLIKEGYNDNVTKTVEEYDELIKAKYEKNENDDELNLLVLQRDLVKNVGQYQLKTFFEDGNVEQRKETFDWLFNNLDVLSLYIAGGAPDGSYLNSLNVLTTLYHTYKEDLSDTTVTAKGTKLCDLYRKMMITLSLTHSTTVKFWVYCAPLSGTAMPNPDPSVSQATLRYQIYKDLYAAGKLEKYFETLEVEEMRYILGSTINDDEIKWMNAYAIGKNRAINGYSYMPYINKGTAPYRYAMYYGDNRANYETKYKLTGFDVGNVPGFPKLWIIMEVGGVCWQISSMGQNAASALGRPSVIVGQPSHVAQLYYSESTRGEGMWGLTNDVFGWTSSNITTAYTGTKSYHTIRLLNGWGNASYASKSIGACYILLGQEALNSYDKYVAAKEKVLLANSYAGNYEKLESIYREAIDIQPTNLDAWVGMINAYKSDSTKTDDDIYELAVEITEKFKYHPLPMSDLIKLLTSNVKSTAVSVQLTLLQNRALTAASKVTNSQFIQGDVCKKMANYLLGKLDTEVAKFSFDGANAGVLSLASKYDASEALWDYSLDGGNTWTEVNTGNSIKLSNKEIESITADNDIKVHIKGVDYSAENIYTIDIKASTALDSTLYANDLENKIIGIDSKIEWRLNEEDDWTSYSEKAPDLTGNKTVEIRRAATGLYMASGTKSYSFTEDNQSDNMKYLSIDHLSIHSFSSQSLDSKRPNYAPNAIDGTPYTEWHTNYAVAEVDQASFIAIKLDSPIYISAIEYVHMEDSSEKYGYLKDATIYVSQDGNEWESVKSVENLTKDTAVKRIELDEPVFAEYVKITMKSHDNVFATAAMLNFFYDSTKVIPTAKINYSITETTAKDVVATLVSESAEIEVLNNNGNNTYTFTENGEFKFIFRDKATQTKGSVVAKVDWITDVNFSLIGDDANKIIFSTKAYQETPNWEYSLDGGTTWNAKNERTYKLTTEEQAILSADNDVKIRTVLESGEKSEVITFDLLSANALPTNLYGNDLENRVIAVTDEMEWKISGTDKWTSYSESKPNLTGDKTVEVRMKAEANRFPSESQTFTFTQDDEDETKQYIPIEHLSVKYVYSECVRPEKNQYEYATNCIDGNIYTWWHSSRVATDDQRYIIIELDEPRYLSMLQYVPQPNYVYGLMKNATVYTSMDGENFEVAGAITDAPNNYEPKNIVFDKTTYAKYVKFQCTKAYDYLQSANADYFICASMLNLFEDVSKFAEIDVEIKYDINELTNQDVTATIVCEDEKIIVTNNDGSDEYVFTENGEFTFEFEDEDGNTGTCTAKVDWIDKVKPEATVTYDIEEITGNDVTATLVSDEEIIITNNDGNNTYTFTKNGTFAFEYKDKAGNTNTTIAEVTWIDKDIPEVTLVYDVTKPTRGNVTVTLECEEEITITNNDGSNKYTFTENGSFTFHFKDKVGNVGSVTATVDWIDTEAPEVTISYDIILLTNRNVVATIESDEEITILNNDGNNTYTFTENGTFEFKYKGKLGNESTAIAEVTWIDKIPPVATVEYDITKLTNQDVTATLVSDEEITILNNDGNNTYTFTENGEFEFTYADKAGNTNTTVAEVTWIDKVAPKVTIIYSTKEYTKENVEAVLTCTELDSYDNLIVTNNNGSTVYTFTENGSFTFEFEDKLGNKGTETAEVTWIEKDEEVPIDKPTFDFNASLDKTKVVKGEKIVLKAKIENFKNIKNGLVALVGKLDFDTTKLEIEQVKGLNSWTFSEEDFNPDNFKFVTDTNEINLEENEIFEITFKVKESAEIGNTEIKFTSIEGGTGETENGIAYANDTKVEFEIANKEETEPDIDSDIYDVDKDDCVITNIETKTKVSDFKNNTERNCDIILLSKDGEKLEDTDKITTGTVVKLVDTEIAYTLVVTGDTDGDGDITINDIAQVKLHYIERQKLQGVYEKAADLDIDNKISVNDIAQIKVRYLGNNKQTGE